MKLLNATMNLGDAAEFIASNYVLGVSHPPGYPLYGLIGHIFSLLPIGSVAWRVNLASLFFGALTMILIYLIVRENTGNILAAAVAVLICLAGNLFLEQSLGAEVYIFNAFFFFLIYYAAIIPRPTKPVFYLSVFLVGLGLGMHYLILFIIPVLIIKFALDFKQNKPLFRQYVILIFAFLLGLTCFVYLPIRAIEGPPVNWGSPHNLKLLVSHLKREQYRILEFGKTVTIQDKILFLREFFEQFFKQYYYLLLFLLPGIFFIKRVGKKSWPALLIFLLVGPGIVFLLQFSFEELNLSRMRAYYLPAFLSLPIVIGIILERLVASARKVPVSRILVLLALLIAVFFPISRHVAENNFRRYSLGLDFGRNMLISLPGNATLFTGGDNRVTPFCYVVTVENRRPDLIIFDLSRNLFYDIFQAYKALSRSALTVPNEKIENYLVNYYLKFNRSVLFSLRPEEKRFPAGRVYAYGLFSAVLPRSAPLPDPLTPFRYFNYRFRKNETEYTEYMEQDVVSGYYYHLGKAYIELGQVEKAGSVFANLSRLGGRLKHIHNNLGVLFKRYGYWLAAEAEFEKALYLDSGYAEAAFNYAQLMEKIDKKKAILAWRKYLVIAAGQKEEARFIKLAGSRLEKLMK